MDDKSFDGTSELGRRGGWRWRWAVLGTTVVLVGVLGVVGVLIWRAVMFPGAPVDQYHRPSPPVPLPAAYYEVAETQIAQGLGLSVADVKADIAADPGEGLFGVATAQGTSPDGLHTIELASLHADGAQTVNLGLWTGEQADATDQYWQGRDPKSLGADMTDWFVHD